MRALVQAGVTMVSRLAKGVDTLAHQAALAAGGRTIAVLGSGLDQIYPLENSAMAKEIADHGALLTEFPLGMRDLVPKSVDEIGGVGAS